jgi:hypothetical protein
MLRIVCAALVVLATACGAAPSLTLVGPNGPISGAALSETTRSWFGSEHGDAFPTAPPPTVRVTGAPGVDLHVQTNAPNATAMVSIEHGTFRDRQRVSLVEQPVAAAIHLDPSPDPYFVTIDLDTGGGSRSALFVVKVDATP